MFSYEDYKAKNGTASKKPSESKESFANRGSVVSSKKPSVNYKPTATIMSSDSKPKVAPML